MLHLSFSFDSCFLVFNNVNISANKELLLRFHNLLLLEAIFHVHRIKIKHAMLDDIDRKIINELQGGFPICERPYAEVAKRLKINEQTLIERLNALLEQGFLSRFGPLYHAEKLGGGLTLAAMKVPEVDFEKIAHQINTFPEIAHNYARNHSFNMWFVIATETPERIAQVIQEIEAKTGLPVYNMPKQAEYFIGLKLDV